jgi:hypothetical protein
MRSMAESDGMQNDQRQRFPAVDGVALALDNTAVLEAVPWRGAQRALRKSSVLGCSMPPALLATGGSTTVWPGVWPMGW